MGIFHTSFSVLLFPTRMPLTFSRTNPHGADRLHMALPPLCLRTPRPPGLAIGMLNIRDGRGFGLAQSIWAVESRGFDVMLLTETKISTTEYFRNWLGYKVNCLKARPTSTRGYQGGVILMTRDRPVGWGIKCTRYHGPNMVS